jgi:4-alpha-glucanotransferase
VLPLVPPETDYWSPYTGLDALCGSTLLLPLPELVSLGLLDAADLPDRQPVTRQADFAAVAALKAPLLEKAAGRLLEGGAFAHLRRCGRAGAALALSSCGSSAVAR